MMASKGIWSGIALALLVIINFKYSDGANVPKDALIKQLLTEYNEKYIILEGKLRDILFNLPIDENPLSYLVSYYEFINEVVRNLRSYPIDAIEDPLVKRQVKKIVDSGLYFSLPFEEVTEFFGTLNNLKSYTTDDDICEYRNKEKCDLAYLPDIKSIIAHSQDPRELEHYWKKFLARNEWTIKSEFGDFIAYVRNVSSEYGYQFASQAMIAEYEDKNLLKEMENVMKELEPLYKEFHAYVYRAIQRKYGELIVPEGGLIPQHLYQQVVAQAWNKKSLLEQPYPKKALPNFKKMLDNNEYKARDLVEASAKFFETLGFEKFNETFWNTYIKQKEGEEVEQDCKPNIHSQSGAIRYCPKVDFRKFLQMHGYMAMAEYAVHRNQHPIGLNDEACPGFANAIGEAVILSASTPKHVTKIDLLDNYEYNEESNLNRLFRFGIHTLFNIPTYFVYTKYLEEVLNGDFSYDKSNCRYWRLMNIYAGVSAPIEREEDDLDIHYKFFEDIEKNQQIKKFFSEVAGYQIYRALCKKSGQYVPGDDKLPLQNCDFYENKDIGKVLKEAMSLGATKHWRDVLELLTGERNLSASALIEYYEPLRVWLQEQNKIHKVKTEWKSDINCEFTVIAK